MSKSSSSSTLMLFVVFVLGSGAFLFFRYAGDKEEKPAKIVSPYETTIVAEKDPPPPIIPKKSQLSLQRDAIWKVLRDFPDTEPEDATERLAYGLGFLLDPYSTEDEIRKGLSILNAHDIREYGGFGKLRNAIQDPAQTQDFRRLELLRYTNISHGRIRLLRSVLKDKKRIEAFRNGHYIPLEDEPWPTEITIIDEPPDEALEHQNLIPGGGHLENMDPRPSHPLNEIDLLHIDLDADGNMKVRPHTPSLKDAGTTKTPPSGGVYE